MDRKNCKRIRHNISLLSWNLNDAKMKNEGLKTKLADFTKIIDGNHIVCLQETKMAVKIADYRCHNSNRKNSRSGGVCICVKNNLSKGTSLINTDVSDDIVAIKLKKSFFGFEQDIALINVYDSQDQSSYKKNKLHDPTTTIEHVNQIISSITIGTKIILLGDFNARSASGSDILDTHFDPQNIINSHNNVHDSIPPRTNKDTKMNSKGRPFLDAIQTNELVILNGRTLGDIFGEFTCYQHNGSSTVDYICVSPELYPHVSKFEVKNLSHISDHCAISATIKIDAHRKILLDPECLEFDDAPLGYKWSNLNEANSSKQFSEAQNDPAVINEINFLLNKTITNKEDVKGLNSELICLFQMIASTSLQKKRNSSIKRKKKWYDNDCRLSKKKLRLATKKFNKNPLIEVIRKEYFDKKREYSMIRKKKKEQFDYEANKEIESGKNIDWKSFKMLKSQNDEEPEYDLFDLQNFFVFFKDLYKKKCQKDDHCPPDHKQQVPLYNDNTSILNEPFTMDEINATIDKLKCNKSVSLDLIANEMIKGCCPDIKKVIMNLFNHCLVHGIYPWNDSITTPLLKTGNIENPDNHRAITLGSCLGKMFSTALLERLVRFRSICCPDPPNQIGFCKGSQTSDHILTLKTITEKYVTRGKGRLYSCFVDYKKAFDRVCREALMYKLTNLGINGPFFNCVKDMYSNSTTRIKLIKKMSAAINVEVGTEQGHPMSPELFKIFMKELSFELDRCPHETNVPELDDMRVSHLLWADDLVLLATDAKSLQRLLDILGEYSVNWELEANMDKTNVMIFNSSGKLLKESHQFSLNGNKIISARKYTYLGVQLSLNGSFKEAIKTLTKKAQWAICQLKRSINKSALSLKSLFTLFDALIKPIAGYANQIWLPDTNFSKELVLNIINAPKQKGILKVGNKDPFEIMHLKYLKWCLGIHKKGSNVCTYGDTGRFPLAISMMDASLKYYKRIARISVHDKNSLVGRAYTEQKRLNLSWYQTWEKFEVARTSHSDERGNGLSEAHQDSFQKELFINAWKDELGSQSKLKFYRKIKNEFGPERYITIKTTTQGKALLVFDQVLMI